MTSDILRPLRRDDLPGAEARIRGFYPAGDDKVIFARTLAN